jgi:sulfite exporter TauE/SafE
MTPTLLALILTAVTISIAHTATGPDHYLPFIVLARSRKWGLAYTILLTTVCGIGHVLSSVLLGLLGVFLGWQLDRIEWFQGYRGNVAGWALFLFGLAYFAYGIRSVWLNRPHKHFDVLGEDVYVYEHRHGEFVMPGSRKRVTPWVLFAIFVMGPSEPLIPLLFYSGAHRSTLEIGVLITVFTLCTILTMLTMVLIGLYGVRFFRTEVLERYMHVISGAVVTLCGAGITFLGW